MRSILLLAALAIGSTVHAGVPVGVNGTWYDPARPGHGFGIEVVDHDTAVAIWHTYDNAGDPLTLYLSGRIEGDSIIADAFAPHGMRFHEFDPADLVEDPWGTVRIDFADCAHATVTYAPTAAGFASGSLPIERLLSPPSAGCDLDALGSVPAGRYGNAHVLPDGTLYHIDQDWLHAQGGQMLRGQPIRSAGGLVVYEIAPLLNEWLCGRHPGACLDEVYFPWKDTIEFRTTATGAVGTLMTQEPGGEILAGPAGTLVPYPGTGDPTRTEQKAVQFVVYSEAAPATLTYLLEVTGTSLCVKPVDGQCAFVGDLDATGAFTLQEQGVADAPVYRGYALQAQNLFQSGIRLIGSSDDGHGLAFCAGALCS